MANFTTVSGRQADMLMLVETYKVFRDEYGNTWDTGIESSVLCRDLISTREFHIPAFAVDSWDLEQLPRAEVIETRDSEDNYSYWNTIEFPITKRRIVRN